MSSSFGLDLVGSVRTCGRRMERQTDILEKLVEKVRVGPTDIRRDESVDPSVGPLRAYQYMGK